MEARPPITGSAALGCGGASRFGVGRVFGQMGEFAMTRDEEALLSALGYVGAGTLASVGEAIAAPPRKPDSPIAPPAPLIGAVWTALSPASAWRGPSCEAAARAAAGGRAVADVRGLNRSTRRHPLARRGLSGHAVIAGTAGTIMARARQKGRKDAAALVLPVLPWVAIATLTLLTGRRGR